MFAPEVTVRGIKLIVMTGDVRQIYGSAGGDTSKNREQVIAGSGPSSTSAPEAHNPMPRLGFGRTTRR